MGLKQARQRCADLRAEIASAKKARAGIGEKAIAEKRNLSDEERTQFAEAKTKIEGLEAQLVDADELLAAAEAANEAERNAPAAPDPDAEAARRALAAAGLQPVITAGQDNTEDDPKRGFKSHREFMASVMAAGRGRVDARLKPLATAGSDEQGTYSDPHGGFLVPAAFSPNILAIAADADPTAALTRKLPMEAPMVKINARVDKNHATSVSGGLRVYRHAETTEATASRMAFEQLTFQAEDLIGLAYATENQISDSPGSFVAMLADGFRDEFGAKLLDEKINGVGASGQYVGLLTSAALITISKQTGQPADTILVENIDKMAARCWRYTSPSTVYLANPTTRPQLRGLVRNVGTGGAPVGYFSQDGGQERLDGRPVFFTEFASAVGDLGDLILVNLSEYIEGLYQSLQQAESVHVRFTANERAFKFWVRNCGMPWWSSVLTPRKGDTLSPIVTLAARA